MSHHNPMELGLFQTGNSLKSQNIISCSDDAWWPASWESIQTETLPTDSFFPFYTLNRLRTKKKKYKKSASSETAANWKNTLFECSALWLLPKMLIVSRRTMKQFTEAFPTALQQRESEDCDVMGSQHKPVWKGERATVMVKFHNSFSLANEPVLGHHHVSRLRNTT